MQLTNLKLLNDLAVATSYAHSQVHMTIWCLWHHVTKFMGDHRMGAQSIGHCWVLQSPLKLQEGTVLGIRPPWWKNESCIWEPLQQSPPRCSLWVINSRIKSRTWNWFFTLSFHSAIYILPKSVNYRGELQYITVDKFPFGDSHFVTTEHGCMYGFFA